MTAETARLQINFETSPDQYRHWRLRTDGQRAYLTLAVDRFGGLDPSIELKGNSYDLSVDIELADAVQRLRFEHPEVRAVVIESEDDRIFCSGANITSLARASHTHKVNFCKYTNETRLYIEAASAEAGQRYLAACKGATAGGGYELALACDTILLADDGSSAVSLPEVPLLGVLPGTGGLTRLIDKRLIRPDLADRFATLAEGVRGGRALDWRLVDRLAPRSRFQEAVNAWTEEVCPENAGVPHGPGVELGALLPEMTGGGVRYRHVELALDRERRAATLTIHGPATVEPLNSAETWVVRMARELDDALLRLRFNEPEIGLVLIRTRGDLATTARAGDEIAHDESWLAREARLLLGRVLRRLDVTARSIFAIVDEESCYGGPLFELLLAADRTYVLDAAGIAAQPGALSAGALPRWNGLSRLETRFLFDPERPASLLQSGRLNAAALERLGLATECLDDLDFEDTLRQAIEERASISPDALTGLEASLRFGGPETMATRIFGRLSAWQNWIFSRPNATGEQGALAVFGKPERPRFDFTRT
ncbi:MAG: enoyl-CoA hydratase-related protein [Chloroflexota bacterium]